MGARRLERKLFRAAGALMGCPVSVESWPRSGWQIDAELAIPDAASRGFAERDLGTASRRRSSYAAGGASGALPIWDGLRCRNANA